MEDIHLSKDFSLYEMLRSENATRNNFTEQFDPPKEIIDSLKLLCKMVLQPLRDIINHPMSTTSGYRCNRVNGTTPGSSSTSQHPKGEAADEQLIIEGKEQNLRLAQEAIKNNLPFDQLILEYGSSANHPAWIHFSYSSKGPQRGMCLRAEHDKLGNPKYTVITKEYILSLQP